jgi:hypothetical protein
MIALKLLLIIASIAALVSLSLLSFMAFNYLKEVTGRSPRLPMRAKIFVWAASIGLLVCFYSGAHTLLFWLPADDWGVIDENEFKSFRYGIALFFIVIGGMAINFVKDVRDHKFYLDRIKRLPELINAYRSRNEKKLKELKEEFSEGVDLIDRLINEKIKSGDYDSDAFYFPEWQRDVYISLIDQADFFIQKLEQEYAMLSLQKDRDHLELNLSQAIQQGLVEPGDKLTILEHQESLKQWLDKHPPGTKYKLVAKSESRHKPTLPPDKTSPAKELIPEPAEPETRDLCAKDD